MSKMSNLSAGTSFEVETAIKKLMRTTKILLENLTLWASLSASSAKVNETYETVEKQFFIVLHVFEELNIASDDLTRIPKKLRDLVSLAMMEKPSQQVLEFYLPQLRETIVHLICVLKEKQLQLRGSRSSSRSNSTSESTTHDIPLEALTRGSSTSSQRLMMYPGSSPPLKPMTSPRMTGEVTRGRNSIPGNDITTRVVPRRSFSPTPQSPSSSMSLLPTKSTSASRRGNSIPTIPPSSIIKDNDIPNPPNPLNTPNMPPAFDENDPNTAIAIANLKLQQNLIRRSSVRRASMIRNENSAPFRILDSPITPFLSRRPRLDSIVAEEDKERGLKKAHGLTLYLQIGNQTKKTVYSGELSVPALNMLFVETFSYTSRQNDFPSIYIHDPIVKVSYELVDITEVKNKSILSLNIDEKDSQRELIEDLSEAFQREMKDVTQLFTNQIEQVKKQFKTSNKVLLDQIKTHMLTNAESNYSQKESFASKNDKEQVNKQLLEIESLKNDIVVLRQFERESKEETNLLIQEIKTGAEKFSKSSEKKESETVLARMVLEDGKRDLLEKSDRVTTRLEDLQDTVDQLKLDVTQRKSRPSEIQMRHCSKERTVLLKEIKIFEDFIVQVKPKWKRTWENELQTIVSEQQELKDHEYLLADIKDDLEALSEVFEQLEKIHAYQISTKPIIREFHTAPIEDGFDGMASVLQQVSTIDVDHEKRLRAMEQAEKMRQRELVYRVDEFEQELSMFVDNKKLRKTGGVLEIDRRRKQKDEEIIRKTYVSKPPRNIGDYE